MKKFFIFATLAVFALATGVTSCKKEQKDECPDAEFNNWLRNNPPPTKSAAEEDPCEDQRIALDKGVTDSTAYASDVRAWFLTLEDLPQKIKDGYKSAFAAWSLPKNTLGDSIIVHGELADLWWWYYGDPFPIPEVDYFLRQVCISGGIYLNQCDTMPFLREDLKKCEDENPVGIDELELDDLNDECGTVQWKNKKTGKIITWEDAAASYIQSQER